MGALLYFDLASPYGYLAVARAAAVLGQPPELEPILLGAIFAWRGSGSWAATPARDMRVAEIEARATHYGLPPMAWPDTWPGNSLAAMRAATWARNHDQGAGFAAAVYQAEFVRGADIADVAVLSACADEAGLNGAEMRLAIHDPEIKAQLRAATQAAWDAGVRGVPTSRVGSTLFYGDDQLELAVAAAR